MINNTLFSWHMFDEHSDLTRLTTVVETMELDDLVHEINLAAPRVKAQSIVNARLWV